MLDPPWAYRQRSGPNGASAPYPTLTTAELAAPPVGTLAARDALLLLWATWSHLPDALELLQAWGFEYVTGLPWIKIIGAPSPANAADAPDVGGPRFTPQYGIGHWVRGCSEALVLAKRGDVRPPTGDFVGLLSPNFGHSRQPESVYELAEQFGGPFVELFARGLPRQGWTAWGAEVAVSAEDAAD